MAQLLPHMVDEILNHQLFLNKCQVFSTIKTLLMEDGMASEGVAAMVSAVGSMLSAVAALATAVYTLKLVKKIMVQLKQTSGYNLTSLSNQQNWMLLAKHKSLPPALPSWDGLTTNGWAWRVLHLNHLNLLLLARQDFERGLINNSEMEGWILKSRYWFQNMSKDDQTYKEGREVLDQLLRPEEGYPDEFCRWLIDSNIIKRASN